jgi:hypothetical protein
MRRMCLKNQRLHTGNRNALGEGKEAEVSRKYWAGLGCGEAGVQEPWEMMWETQNHCTTLLGPDC